MRRRFLVAGLLAVALTGAWAPTAGAATDFFSSFEESEPPPTWESTAETDAERRQADVRRHRSTRPTGIPGNITRPGRRPSPPAARTRPARSPCEPRSTATSTPSGSSSSRRPGCSYKLSEPVAVVHYALTLRQRRAGARPAGLDAPGLARRQRPGRRSTPRPTRTFGERFQTKEYAFANDRRRTCYYRLNITAQPRRRASSSSPSSQLSDGDTTPPRPRTCAARSATGPRSGYNAKASVGFTGVARARSYAGGHTADGPRLRLQQGLRRRPRGHADDRAVVPDLPRAQPTTT